MSIYVGRSEPGSLGQISSLRFAGSYDNQSLAGYTFTSKGSAQAKSDPALHGAFIALQRAINSYIDNRGLNIDRLKVDGIIGNKTLIAARAVINHHGTTLGVDPPSSIRNLADRAVVYAAKIVWAAQQAGGGPAVYDPDPQPKPTDTEPPRPSGGTATTTGGKPPTPTPQPKDGSGSSATPRQTASIAGGGLSPMVIAGIGLIGIGGILWWKKRGG